MGLVARTSGRVTASAVPSFSLVLTPGAVEIPFGSVSMVAQFAVTIVREAGHTKPVFLDLEGMAGNWSFSAASFIPGIDAPVTLSVDIGGFQKGMSADFDVVGYDDPTDMPPLPEG